MDMTNQNGYLVPKMAMKETHRPPVGRIGLQREKFLQENHSLLYDKMLLDGTLYSDLKQTEQRYWKQVEQTITKLLVSNPAPDKKALLGLLGMAMNRTEPVSIGRYKGFDLQIAYFAMDKMYLAYLVGSGINPVQLGADAVGNTMRLDNCLHNLPQSVTDLESKLVQLQKQLENAKEQLAQPFAQADELAEKSKRLAELEALLNLNEKDIVLDTVPDEDQQCRSDNRQRGQER